MPYKNNSDKLKNAKRYRNKTEVQLRRKAWWDAHPDYKKARYEERFTAHKAILMDARKNGCVDCPEKNPVCLDFDHRDPKQKKFNISKGLFRNTKDLLAEIAKCDVRCANCHRKRTAEQQHWHRKS